MLSKLQNNYKIITIDARNYQIITIILKKYKMKALQQEHHGLKPPGFASMLILRHFEIMQKLYIIVGFIRPITLRFARYCGKTRGHINNHVTTIIAMIIHASRAIVEILQS